MGSCTSITSGADDAVEELRDQFPSLKSLITLHEDPEDLRETTNMANWIAQSDHIQMEHEIRLRQNSQQFWLPIASSPTGSPSQSMIS